MATDTTRGCIVCNVVVRRPALVCHDCGPGGGNGDGYLTGNDDVLVFLRDDGPVEVTETLLDEMMADIEGAPPTTGAAILTWMKGALAPPVVPRYEDIVD